ncbi:MAG TPA: hypothetical protein PKJ83_02420 [Cyclobacteriaceae bacterium]|nr:hypothetical protein [Cyclobacteriaceae bacterium]HPW61097.1 hypothetical protein [Cyclobacteriaceae bacterium]
MSVVRLRFVFLVILTTVSVTLVNGQKQLILLKRGDVIARFTEGEYIKCELKNKTIVEGIAIRFNDFSILTLNDTIPFESIYKINVKGRRKANTLNKLGTVMMIAGVGYFVIDQINTLIVDGQNGIDEQVVITSVALTATGAALRFIRSPYQKLRGLSLRTIDPTSRYYQYD